MSTGALARLQLREAVAAYRAGEPLEDAAMRVGGGADVARLILKRAGVPLRARREWQPDAA